MFLTLTLLLHWNAKKNVFLNILTFFFANGNIIDKERYKFY